MGSSSTTRTSKAIEPVAAPASLSPRFAPPPVPAADGADGDGTPSLVLVVMDPLAAQLSCPCVKGYAQRDYDALATHLSHALGRPVRLGFGESLTAGLEAAKADRADIVIGKDSVVRADAAKAGATMVAAWVLTDADGSIETRGLFVVAAEDAAQSLDEIIDFCAILGIMPFRSLVHVSS